VAVDEFTVASVNSRGGGLTGPVEPKGGMMEKGPARNEGQQLGNCQSVAAYRAAAPGIGTVEEPANEAR
jgi:hypothetical protein